jgi:hypothetical protein
LIGFAGIRDTLLKDESPAMTTNDKHANACQALQAGTAAVCRHGPEGVVDVLCLATRLETGVWATVRDRGVYGDKVRGQTRGLLEAIDLHLHTMEDDVAARRVLPVRWASQTPIDPIVLLGVPGDDGLTPFVVPSGELIVPEYQHIYVAVPRSTEDRSRGDARRPQDVDLTKPLDWAVGSVFGPPMLQPYRDGMSDGYRHDVSEDDRDSIIENARRKRTVCVHGDMGRPNNSMLGGPVVETSGRLAGVIVGAGQGFQYDHVGAYVPVDLLIVLAQTTKAQWAAAHQKGRHAYGIDIVSHESTDVYWDEPDRPRDPRTHLDQPVKIVMTRRRLNDVVTAANAGLYEPDAHPDTKEERDALAASVGELVGLLSLP